MTDRPECAHKESCTLFPLFRLRSSLHYWMENYCAGEFERCHRYQSMCAGRPPPPTMLPNGKHVHAIGDDSTTPESG